MPCHGHDDDDGMILKITLYHFSYAMVITHLCSLLVALYIFFTYDDLSSLFHPLLLAIIILVTNLPCLYFQQLDSCAGHNVRPHVYSHHCLQFCPFPRPYENVGRGEMNERCYVSLALLPSILPINLPELVWNVCCCLRSTYYEIYTH